MPSPRGREARGRRALALCCAFGPSRRTSAIALVPRPHRPQGRELRQPRPSRDTDRRLLASPAAPGRRCFEDASDGRFRSASDGALRTLFDSVHLLATPDSVQKRRAPEDDRGVWTAQAPAYGRPRARWRPIRRRRSKTAIDPPVEAVVAAVAAVVAAVVTPAAVEGGCVHEKVDAQPAAAPAKATRRVAAGRHGALAPRGGRPPAGPCVHGPRRRSPTACGIVL